MKEPASPTRRVLLLEPLSAARFAPYGDVIEATPDAPHHGINDGFAERYHDLARIDTARDGGRTLVNIFRTRPRALPLQLSVMEHHRLGSQLFMPLSPQRFIVVVAEAGPVLRAEALKAFVASPGQGVNLARGTWHHPLLALNAGGDFLVIDRGGPGPAEDCVVQALDQQEIWICA